MKKPCAGRDGINVRFWSGGGYSVGGLYFQITSLNKKLSDPLENVRPLLKSPFTSCEWPVFRHEPTL